MRCQDPAKSFPEFGVKYGVNNGIEGRVGVAQPCEYLEYNARYAGLAESGHDIDAEEWHPAYQKDTHDDPYRYGSFVVRHVIWRGLMNLDLAGKGMFGRSGLCGRRIHSGTEIGRG